MSIRKNAVKKQHALLLRAMSDIAGLLDGQEWTPETTEAIAEIMRGAGFEIRDPEEIPD